MSGALLAKHASPVFARHETFHLRFGWLRKGYAATMENPSIFSEPDATVVLGVGKNMVNSIRYWCQAYKIIEPIENIDRPRVPNWQPTEFANQLFGEIDGWDPWLEDPASLWLLHWRLLADTCLAPAWWAAFNVFSYDQFEESQLTAYVHELAEAAGWRSVVEASIKKDVDCLLRTFAARRVGRQTLDDVLDCPTRQLGLLRQAPGESKSWRFVTGIKPSLPAAIVAFACLDYMGDQTSAGSTITLARLANDPCSPGRAFRLTESNLFEILNEAKQELPGIRIEEPAGLRQMITSAPASELRDQILNAYYDSAKENAA